MKKLVNIFSHERSFLRKYWNVGRNDQSLDGMWSFVRKMSSDMESNLVLFRKGENGVGWITLNDPKKRNALSFGMLSQLYQRFQEVDQQSDIKVVILAAKGPVFSSGHDLKEIFSKKEDTKYHRELFGKCTQVMLSIRNLSKPVIAQVHGLATAAGCQLAATCDMVVASEQAQFATPGVKVGLFCSTPAVAIARELNNNKKMMEMLFTGKPISASEALQFGLINRITSPENLETETMKLADDVVNHSSSVNALGKKIFYEQIALPLEDAYSLAEKAMVENLANENCMEGIDAFAKKRKPNWKD